MHEAENQSPNAFLLPEETDAQARPSAANEKPKPDQYVSESLAAVERAWRQPGSKRQLEGQLNGNGNGSWFSGCFDEV